jgi:site-specific DNA-methyltransferase (adenine-specific)
MKPYYQSKGITIYHGDSREVIPKLTGKVNSIVTDPIYVGRQFVHLYAPIWKASDRLLKNESTIFIMIGQNLIKDIIEGVPKSWSYLWCASHVFPSRSRFWPLGLRVGWRPILVFGKKFTGKFAWYSDCIEATPGSHKTNKSIHRWGQNIPSMEALIKRFKIKGPILEPFMGGGSTLFAARNLGLKAVGIELEEKTCEAVANRLENIPVVQSEKWEQML